MKWCLVLLLATVSGQATITLDMYMDSSCSSFMGSQTLDYDGTCDEGLADFKQTCQGGGFSEADCAGYAYDECFQSPDLAQGGIPYAFYTCVEVQQEPTEVPTSASCTDSIENGDEEGVDCGGSCPDSCPLDCSTYEFCGANYTLVDDAETFYCSAYPCDNDDLETCCVSRALCSTITDSVNCGIGTVLVSSASSTYCEDTDCKLSDRATCCVEAGTCEDFMLCNNETQYLKSNPGLLNCIAEVCDESDISKCCEDRAVCSGYRCDYAAGKVNVDDGENIYCALNTCEYSDAPYCCTDRASCDNFTCDSSQFVAKSDMSSLYCSGSECGYLDNWGICCDEKQVCKDSLFTYPCGEFGLNDDPENSYCAGTDCTADDLLACCQGVDTVEQTLDSQPGVTYIFSNVNESCHNACDRRGDFYCEQQSVPDPPEQLELMDLWCTGNLYGIAKSADHTAPHMLLDGSCEYSRFSGQHTCGSSFNGRRLCGCVEHIHSSHVQMEIAGDGSGWYDVRDESCLKFCSDMGLECDAETMTSVRGLYDLYDVLDATGTDRALCTHVNDLLSRYNSPYRNDEKNVCYVHPLNGTLSRSSQCMRKQDDPNNRFCYCAASMR